MSRHCYHNNRRNYMYCIYEQRNVAQQAGFEDTVLLTHDVKS